MKEGFNSERAVLKASEQRSEAAFILQCKAQSSRLHDAFSWFTRHPAKNNVCNYKQEEKPRISDTLFLLLLLLLTEGIQELLCKTGQV